MEPSPGPWISALRHSHDRLRASVEPLGLTELERRSYASEWSIAQVLSHLGSQAEIFGLFLDAGLAGQEPPGREEFMPIWDSWNGKDPRAQASDALRADQATLERFESLDADEQARLHLKMFGMELGAAGLARMRVSEHAIHTWDVVVALDPAATVAPDAALAATTKRCGSNSARRTLAPRAAPARRRSGKCSWLSTAKPRPIPCQGRFSASRSRTTAIASAATAARATLCLRPVPVRSRRRCNPSPASTRKEKRASTR